MMGQGLRIYSFKGMLTDKFMENIFQEIEEVLVKEPEPKVIRKRVFNVLVELIQNIYTYTASLPLAYRDMLLLVQKTKRGYELIAGNFIDEKGIKKMESKLRAISYLTEDQLDKVYTRLLALKMAPRKETGGLGLLEIARKTNRNVDFQSSPVDEGFAFFTIKTLVKNLHHGKIQ